MMKRIVALDVGDRRIGIAVSDPLGYTAQPLETYTRVGYGPDTRHIKQICFFDCTGFSEISFVREN